jgi:hypothetical protein
LFLSLAEQRKKEKKERNFGGAKEMNISSLEERTKKERKTF